MLFRPLERNVPSRCKGNVICTTWLERSLSVKREMLFGPQDRNVRPCDKENVIWAAWQERFLRVAKQNVIFYTWKGCYILVKKVTVYSAYGKYITNM